MIYLTDMSTQTERLYDLLADGKPHRTDEIMSVVYGSDHLGLARVGARIYDLKKKRKLMIRSYRDADKRSLTWYQIIKPVFNGITVVNENHPRPEKRTEQSDPPDTRGAGQDVLAMW